MTRRLSTAVSISVISLMFRVRRSRKPILLLLLAACRDALSPLPPDARPLVPTPIQYATWWRMTEACARQLGNFKAIRWYEIPEYAITIDGEEYDGYWFRGGDRILLTGRTARVGQTVRHEMLHALLNNGGHPVEYFVNRCGALAPCGTACDLRESDRGVPATARVVTSESLTVSATLAPSGAPALSIDSGWVTMTVTATNTRAEPVWVTIPFGNNLGYRFKSMGETIEFSYESRWAFRAGESRSLAFDVQLPVPGTRDTLWGLFGNRSSPAIPITVGP